VSGVRRPAAWLLLLAGLLVHGCAALRRAPETLVPVAARDLPGFEDDLDLASLRLALERTLPAYRRTRDEAALAAARRLLEVLEARAEPAARRAALARAFRVTRVRDPVLLTAYYEPELDARLVRDATYRHPIYARPPDLVDVDPHGLDATCGCRPVSGRLERGRLRPYLTRGEIDAGALAGRGLEIAWVADPIALFSLHVQGSGLLRLPDGRRVAVRYAGTNGRPYRSLGRELVARGFLPLDRAGMPEIRRLLASLPDEERRALLAVNERYTFFRLAEGEPIGSLGVPLTPGRSVATDPRVVPPGAIGYLVTPTVRRFVVSQDTGGAVTGAHADLFLGRGADAEQRAGRMRDRGRLYVLRPR
jgi:membrane-bound lytic murein transglycosylase A